MGRWKLVHNGGVPANAIKGPAKDTWELFDLAADPGEQADVADQQGEIYADLRARLTALRAEAAVPHLVSNVAPEGFTVPKVWGETRSR